MTNVGTGNDLKLTSAHPDLVCTCTAYIPIYRCMMSMSALHIRDIYMYMYIYIHVHRLKGAETCGWELTIREIHVHVAKKDSNKVFF